MTGDQVREARRLLGWSRDRLAAACSLSPDLIRVFERTGRIVQPLPTVTPEPLFIDRLDSIRLALETAGVMFTDGDEPGVKLRNVAS